MVPRSSFVDPHWAPQSGAIDQPQTVYSDMRVAHPPPHQAAAYPTPFQIHSGGNVGPPEMLPSPTSEEIHRSFRGMVVEDDRAVNSGSQQHNFQQSPAFPPPYYHVAGASYHPYPQVDYAKYYHLAPTSSEPFVESAFQQPQNQPPYRMQHLTPMVNHTHYTHLHSKYPPLIRMHNPNYLPIPVAPSAGMEHPVSMPPGTAFPAAVSQTFYPIPHLYPVQHADAQYRNGGQVPQQDPSPGPAYEYFARQPFTSKIPSPIPPVSPHMANSGLSPQPQGPRQIKRIYSSERSPLLEDFRTRRDKIWNIKDILGHVTEFSADQHGSRFIQLKLETATEDEKHAVFIEFYPHFADQLMRDVFGNYVVQKFFDFGTNTQRDALASIVQKQALELSMHIYGCRVVQKAIDCISEEQQASIINRLEQDILTCIKDAHGNHVIQKIVGTVPPDRLTFLPFICENILDLSTHPFGCRVLQRCLEHLPSEANRPLINAVHHHTLKLVHDQYGNYVIQFIIEHGQSRDKALVVSKIRGNLVALSKHKFASNVCEKALASADSTLRRALIEEILATPVADAEPPILTMMKDQFANYVIQCALNVVEGDQREELYTRVKSSVAQLRKVTTTYNRPLAAIERLVEKYFRKRSTSRTNIQEKQQIIQHN